MVCPFCSQTTRVTNSRPRQNSLSVWRRRFCQKCQQAFSTTETINTESLIALKDEYGILKSLNYEDIYISVFQALGGLKEASETAKHLTLSCLNKVFKQQKPLLSEKELQTIIFETLTAFQKEAGQRYQLSL